MAGIIGMEKENFLEKMREIKANVEQSDETGLVEVKEVKYLGKIDTNKNIDGIEDRTQQDIFLVLEDIDGHVVSKVYNSEMDCLAVYDGEFGLLPEKDYMDEHFIIEQIQEKDLDGKLDLTKIEAERLEEIAKALGVKVEDLKKVSEIDLEEDIDKQLEIEEDEEELDDEESKDLISGKQEIDLDVKVDDKHSLGQKLDLNATKDGLSDSVYTKLVVVETEDLDELEGGEDLAGSSTRYSFVALRADGTARVVNDKLELDMSSGSNPSKESIKADADGTVRKDNSTLSRYKINGRDEYLSLENGEYGEIKAYYGKGKTRDDNMNIETQLETTNVRPTPIELREMQKDEKGIYNNDKIQDEAEQCFDKGEDETSLKNADGDEQTKDHIHVDEEYIKRTAEEICKTSDEIDRAFTLREVENKLRRDIDMKKDSTPLDQIIEQSQRDMEEDAQRIPTRDEIGE